MLPSGGLVRHDAHVVGGGATPRRQGGGTGAASPCKLGTVAEGNRGTTRTGHWSGVLVGIGYLLVNEGMH